MPGLPLEDIDAFTDEIDAPLNVLYQPGQTVEDLAARGAARISTGSMLFRAALQTGVAAAVALRAGDDLGRAQLPSYAAVDSLAGEETASLERPRGSGLGGEANSKRTATAPVRGW